MGFPEGRNVSTIPDGAHISLLYIKHWQRHPEERSDEGPQEEMAKWRRGTVTE